MSKFQRRSISTISRAANTPLPVALPIADVFADPDQPRKKKRDETKLKALAASMKAQGQLQAIIVRAHPDGTPDKYMIILGEGRWLGAQINESETINAVISEETDLTVIKAMQIIENIHREEMDQIDLAESFRDLIDTGACKNAKAVSDLVNFSESTISVYLNMLKAPPQIQDLVRTDIATIDTARSLNNILQINPDLAQSMIDRAKETGTLKRDETRAAEAVEKERQGIESKKPKKAGPKGENPPPAADNATSTNGSAAETKGPGKTDAPTVDGGVKLESKEKKNDAEKDARIIPVPAFDVHVEVRKGAASRPAFDFNYSKHGAAILARETVHSDPAKAWLMFGHGTDDSMLVPFPAADLMILKVIRQG
ncbi:ParB/RepB/Spo0J family partition protein [Janthinobacterium sp. MDT1-19]|uniref:ParB/RepB/Spo0J family partition protein n=1 Tax=Janthinobacterium sp. MDT1-19 TaxID=1259339 RepID=UPI003F223EFA